MFGSGFFFTSVPLLRRQIIFSFLYANAIKITWRFHFYFNRSVFTHIKRNNARVTNQSPYLFSSMPLLTVHEVSNIHFHTSYIMEMDVISKFIYEYPDFLCDSKVGKFKRTSCVNHINAFNVIWLCILLSVLFNRVFSRLPIFNLSMYF